MPASWRLLLRHPLAYPTLVVVAATLCALAAAAQPHTAASRLALGAAATAAALGIGWAWKRGRSGVPLALVLAVAAVLRLLALPLGPTLSDDAYRYVWDGLVQEEGVNPYARLPDDDALRPLRSRLPFDALNSTRYYSVYPPASQLAFRLAVGLAGEGAEWLRVWAVLKLLLLACEALAVLLLVRLAPARAVLVYAWHPLPVLEIAGQGHTEAAMLPALVLVAYALAAARPGRGARMTAGAALAWATMVKLVPVVLAPFALRKGGGWAVAAGVVIGGLLAWPYAAPYVLPNVGSSLDLYVRYFEFNAGPYFALKWIGRWATGEDVSKLLGPALRGVFVAGLLPLWAVAWGKRWRFAPAALVGWAWFFCTTTTVHPWYLLGALVLVPLVMDRPEGRRVALAWAALAAGSLWTYTLYGGLDRVYWIAVIAIWLIWSCLLTLTYGTQMLTALMRHRARAKWAWISHALPSLTPTTRLLDLGAGEGFVGAAARAASGAQVQLCDVTDFNQTALPHVVGDGRTVPFPDGSFDVVVLAFVLHHAADPEQVLREVHRVLAPGGRVAVLESVAETRRDDRVLHVLDPLANRLRSGGRMMDQEKYLAFRSAAAWRETFRTAGFEVSAEDRRGQFLHKRHLFGLIRT